ncbi:hypothetical protein SPRG_21324, partial [Saprolegnia parasitica CBS 223.65]
PVYPFQAGLRRKELGFAAGCPCPQRKRPSTRRVYVGCNANWPCDDPGRHSRLTPGQQHWTENSQRMSRPVRMTRPVRMPVAAGVQLADVA